MVTMFTNGISTTGFTLPQPFGVYPWQAYVPPHDGLWPILGVNKVAVPSNALSDPTHSANNQPFHQYGG